jgi:glycosyltransferase involved in cell wall biosynthesis
LDASAGRRSTSYDNYYVTARRETNEQNDIMRPQNPKKPVVLSVFGLVPLRIGGTERYCRELSIALHECGWHSVLAFEGTVNPVVSDYLRLPSVTIENLPSMTTGGVETLIELHKLIRKCRPDIVHLHYTGFVTLFPWLAKLSGVRQVYLTNHASYPEGFQARPTAQPKRTLASLINSPVCGIVCPSDFGRRSLIETGILAADKFRVIYNGTHPGQITDGQELSANFRMRYQIPNDRVIVTQVGQLIPEKGIDDLLIAFKHAAEIDNRLHLVLVGEGHGRHRYEVQIADWNLSSRITLTGLIEDTAVAGVYEACDICCLTSRWEELFGFVLVEAMARSKPVVATRVGGIPEVVSDSETGYLVERGDTHGITARLLELAKRPRLRELMGRAGRERVEELFDVQNNVQQVLEFCGIK